MMSDVYRVLFPSKSSGTTSTDGESTVDTVGWEEGRQTTSWSMVYGRKGEMVGVDVVTRYGCCIEDIEQWLGLRSLAET